MLHDGVSTSESRSGTGEDTPSPRLQDFRAAASIHVVVPSRQQPSMLRQAEAGFRYCCLIWRGGYELQSLNAQCCCSTLSPSVKAAAHRQKKGKVTYTPPQDRPCVKINIDAKACPLRWCSADHLAVQMDILTDREHRNADSGRLLQPTIKRAPLQSKETGSHGRSGE